MLWRMRWTSSVATDDSAPQLAVRVSLQDRAEPVEHMPTDGGAVAGLPWLTADMAASLPYRPRQA